MKPIYLQLDELGPWVKFNTPPISPRRRVFSSAIHQGNNRRVRTVYVNSASPQSLTQDNFLKDLPEPQIRELPLLEPVMKNSGITKHSSTVVPEFVNRSLPFSNEFIADSPHVTHQYFPYRQTTVNFMQKSFRPLPSKNAYPIVKKKRNFSLSPATKKNYVFWNQRKLVGNKLKKGTI